MKILSQRNKFWANIKLGSSNLTLGRYGCTTTCISMLSDYFGAFFNPDTLARNVKLYTSDGLIIWKNLMVANFKFERREYGRNDTEIMKALKDPNRAVILEVANHSHWVVCIGKTLFGNYKIADPWFGDISTMARYKNDITGAAYFQRL